MHIYDGVRLSEPRRQGFAHIVDCAVFRICRRNDGVDVLGYPAMSTVTSGRKRRLATYLSFRRCRLWFACELDGFVEARHGVGRGRPSTSASSVVRRVWTCGRTRTDADQQESCRTAKSTQRRTSMAMITEPIIMPGPPSKSSYAQFQACHALGNASSDRQKGLYWQGCVSSTSSRENHTKDPYGLYIPAFKLTKMGFRPP